MKFKMTKNKIIGAVTAVIILLAAFWYGGGAPGLQGWGVSPSAKEVSAVGPGEEGTLVEILEIDEIEDGSQHGPEAGNDLVKDEEGKNDKDEEGNQTDSTGKSKKDLPKDKSTEQAKMGDKATEEILEKTESKLALKPTKKSETKASNQEKAKLEPEEIVINKETGKDKYLTDSVPAGKPVPIEPQNAKITDVAHTATLSVRCDTILDNIDWLNSEKVELVPEDGVIFPTTQVTFYEGESVFNVLQREMKKAKIHMEFMNTPIYNSAYIEGIHNLYEFDCGELSGWMYKANDWFPNYGSSRYQLKSGDVIEWVYTCDLGLDVGGHHSARQ